MNNIINTFKISSLIFSRVLIFFSSKVFNKFREGSNFLRIYTIQCWQLFSKVSYSCPAIWLFLTRVMIFLGLQVKLPIWKCCVNSRALNSCIHDRIICPLRFLPLGFLTVYISKASMHWKFRAKTILNEFRIKIIINNL